MEEGIYKEGAKSEKHLEFDGLESIHVFTHRSVEFLTKLGGSTSWILDPIRAQNCEYLICSRNNNNGLAESDGIDHKSAFLIGRVSNVVPSLNIPRDENRFMVEFSEFALITLDNFWQGERNPIVYLDTWSLLTDGYLDFSTLNWQKVPERNLEYVQSYFANENAFYEQRESNVSHSKKRKAEVKNSSVEGMSIVDAKKELSKFYSLPLENIEIILKG
ncbi:hypothetical protein OAU37_00815 [Gammaproteobacteria bacterium]|nr:hypothetical protein [Gammaproteobacteria bacterium]